MPRMNQNSFSWPEITRDVKCIVAACCLHTVKLSNRVSPMNHCGRRLDSRPWEKLGVDLCLYGGQNYIVMVYYYTRWIEVLHVKSTTIAACVVNMKDVFAGFGFPEEVVQTTVRNLRQRNSDRLLRENGLLTQRQTSSNIKRTGKPREQYKRPNESFVMYCQRDPWLALLIYRDTII